MEDQGTVYNLRKLDVIHLVANLAKRHWSRELYMHLNLEGEPLRSPSEIEALMEECKGVLQHGSAHGHQAGGQSGQGGTSKWSFTTSWTSASFWRCRWPARIWWTRIHQWRSACA